MTISEPRNIQAIPPSWERELPTESDEERNRPAGTPRGFILSGYSMGA